MSRPLSAHSSRRWRVAGLVFVLASPFIVFAAYSGSATISLVNESAYVLRDVSFRDPCFIRETPRVDPGMTKTYWVFPCGDNVELHARAHDRLLSTTTYLSIIPHGRVTFRVHPDLALTEQDQ
jgi:hypothetical protein